MNRPLKLLLVEDNADDAGLLLNELHRGGYDVTFQRVDTEQDYRRELEAGPELVISDYHLPQFDGLRALKLLNERGLDIPFILVSGTVGEDMAVSAMREGASDYLLKDRLSRLGKAVGQALDSARMRAERRELDAALRRSEDRFRTTLEALAEGCQIIARDWRYLYVNPAAAQQGRRTVGEMVGRRVQEVFPGIENLDLFEPWKLCMQDGVSRRIESQLFHADGSHGWFEVLIQAVPDGLFVVSVDVTERKRAEEALGESERRFRSMLEGIDLIAVTLDERGTVLFCNDFMLRLTGWRRDEVIGQDWFKMFIPSSDQETPRIFAEGIRLGKIPARRENPILTRSGELRQIMWSNTTLLRPSGEPNGTASIGEDVTARRGAEEALRSSEERFRQVVENIREAFWMIDVQTNRVMYVSPGYETIWGRSSEQFYGSTSTWSDSIHTEDRMRVMESAASKRVTGDYDEIYRVIRPDGSIRWVHEKAFPIREADGKVRRVVGVADDVSDRKQLESQFLRAQRLEAIGTLSSGIAHDLNNILAPTMMVVSLLRDKLSDPGDLELLGMVDQGAQRGANIIKQLLTFSRGIEGDRGSIQTRHLMREMAALMRETFPRDIRIVDTTPGDLPAVIADGTQLSQVLMNLCVNARDAMPEGGKLTLSAHAITLHETDIGIHVHAKPGHYVVLSVADTGQGIPPALLDRIFEPFFTTKEQGKGTGLGLSTVMGIAKSHGGFVTVTSENGRGSLFSVYLPAIREEIEPEVGSRPPPLRGRNQLVLVVDDEISIRKVIGQTLERNRYRVLQAPDGRDALTVFLQNRSAIRLLITDIMMPSMGGIALIRAIRALEPQLRIIAMSGLSDEDRRAELAELGVPTLLSKPCSAEVLLDTVHRELDVHR